MKKKFRMIIILSLAIALSLGMSSVSFAAKKTISKAKAKTIALKEASVKKSEVKKWIKIKLDNYDDDNDQEWDVEFQTGTYKYEIEINARTGKVEDYERKKIKKNTSKITEKKAKSIALKVADVKSSAVKKWTKVKLDGNEWDIKFQTSNYKYEVEINASTGKVKEIDKEKIPKDSSKYIGVAKAKEIALKHAKKHKDVSGSVRYTKAELDKDDYIPHYEIEFVNGGWEFEYEIHAKTGDILEWDIEVDD